ncbi:hypothetical protein F442_15466 [Phytophthora nicotianae P10297]|uniref:Photolyase/cryptochrome alpha/beta domain-containing protein n=1 Tax=Phytophthora nicotianae P10297 TaxID=1317064 RepID=W2YNX5_PHYNI|nr:hypothetical protein F442_15466 [Phytophthora nicotianae P10297]
MVKIGVHVFRKDLQVQDNLALNELAGRVDQVIGVFVLDQILRTGSPHFSSKTAQFLIQCVESLNKQCDNKLVLLRGNPAAELRKLLEAAKPVALSFNSDFTPYAVKRDKSVIALCEHLGVDVIVNDADQTLAPMSELVKESDHRPYMTFGSFDKRLSTVKIQKPTTKKIVWIKPRRVVSVAAPKLLTSSNNEHSGGREEAMRRLNNAVFHKPAVDHLGATSSQLSAFLNLGCLSVREVYWRRRYAARSIAWRDFFLCIYRLLPGANGYNTFIDPRYNKVRWPRLNKSEWVRFTSCKTGFLLIDAAMAE